MASKAQQDTYIIYILDELLMGKYHAYIVKYTLNAYIQTSYAT
jgi:hypothetical protein